MSIVFKLAALALPIFANPYNHNPPMQEHSHCTRDSAASLSMYCKISMSPIHFQDLYMISMGKMYRLRRQWNMAANCLLDMSSF
jgi:hypothetical protein